MPHLLCMQLLGYMLLCMPLLGYMRTEDIPYADMAHGDTAGTFTDVGDKKGPSQRDSRSRSKRVPTVAVG
jgi:hypothetical protein